MHFPEFVLVMKWYMTVSSRAGRPGKRKLWSVWFELFLEMKSGLTLNLKWLKTLSPGNVSVIPSTCPELCPGTHCRRYWWRICCVLTLYSKQRAVFFPCPFTKIDHVPFIKEKKNPQISKGKVFTANICLYCNPGKLEVRKRGGWEASPRHQSPEL